MSGYLARLNSSERRFVVGVALLLFVIINIFFIFPRFKDWGVAQGRIAAARQKLQLYQAGIAQQPKLEQQIRQLGDGQDVPPEDQSTQFLRNIQMQANQSGVGLISTRQTTRTNASFIEQIQTITVQSGEKQLVDFLYNIGAGGSQARVRGISVRPDQPHQRLNAQITLVASYRKTQPGRRATGRTGAQTAQPATTRKQ